MNDYQRSTDAARERWEQQEEAREKKVTQYAQRTGAIDAFPEGSDKARNLNLNSDGSYQATDVDKVLAESSDAGDINDAGVRGADHDGRGAGTDE